MAEEASFPRGGQQLLSAVEMRQIKHKAEQDVLFQERQGDDSDQPPAKRAKPTPGKAKNPSGKSKGKDTQTTSSVLPLTIKSLQPGVSLLGAIKEVEDFQLTVSLPNGLTGSVALQSISAHFSEFLQRKVDEGSDSDASDGDDESDSEGADESSVDGDLSSMFRTNMLVQCAVEEVDKAGTKPKVKLTLDPAVLNKDLDKDSLYEGRLISASVVSKEEHGYVMDCGVEGTNCFLSNKHAAEYIEKLNHGKSLSVGQPLLCVSLNTVKGERAVKLSCHPGRVKSAIVEASNHPSFESLQAGQLVQCQVSGHDAKRGLEVSLYGLKGTIDSLHLREPVKEEDALSSLYPIKSKLKARIIFVDPNAKMIKLSIQPHHVDPTKPIEFTHSIGDIVDDCRVVRVDQGHGLLMTMGEDYGYCHISCVSDQHLDKFGKAHKAGTVHRARVTGINTMDRLLQLSLQQSVLSAPFLRYEDIAVGTVVEGTILTLEPFGALINITEHIRGLCPSIHLADITLKHPERKFKPGVKVVCRVLKNFRTASGKRKLVLTHKKTLVKSKLAIIDSYESARRGVIAHGFVSSVRDYGIIIEFCGGVRGLVASNQLGVHCADPADAFKEGQVVKCRVTSKDAQPGRLRLTMRPDILAKEDDADAPTASLDAVETGSTVDVEVVSSSAEGVEVKLVEQPDIKATIAPYHLGDHPFAWSDLHKLYKPGNVIEDVLVVAKEGSRHSKLVLSCKPLLKQTSKTTPEALTSLEKDAVYAGYIRNVVDFGVFVGLVHGTSGLVDLRHLADRFIDTPSSHFVVGQSVLVKVVEVDTDKEQVLFSLKESDIENMQTSSFTSSLFEDVDRVGSTGDVDSKLAQSKYRAGNLMQTTVTAVKDYGIVTSSDGVPGLITSEQAKGIDCKAGDTLKARILDVDRVKGVLDLSARPEVVSAKVDKSKKPKKKQVEAVIELVKEDYLILSLPGGHLAYAATRSFNDRRDPFRRFIVGRKGVATVLTAKAPRVLVRFQLHQDKREDQKTKAAAVKASLSEVQPGQVISAKIVSITETQINLELPSKIKGRIHITEVLDENEKIDSSVLDLKARFKKNQTVSVKVIGYHDAKTHRYLPITHRNAGRTVLDCSLKPSRIQADELTLPLSKLSELKVGQRLCGFVQEAQPDHLWISVSPMLRGRVHRLEASTELATVKDLVSNFPVGTRVTATVRDVDDKRNRLNLCIVPPVRERVAKDALLIGIVKKHKPLGVVVEIGPHAHGIVHVTDCADHYKADMEKMAPIGEEVLCKVLSIEKLVNQDKNAELDVNVGLSLRPSRVTGLGKAHDLEINSAKDIKADQVLRGFVKQVSDNGVFVALGRDVTARVQICNLSDLFIKDFKSAFAKGTLVKGKVLHVDRGTNRIEMSLKKSSFDASAERTTFESLKEEQVVTGVIKRVETYGAFVTIDNSNVTALAHISECSEKFIKDLKEVFTPGDSVKGVIIKKDEESRRVSLSLKPSRLASDDDAEVDMYANVRKQSAIRGDDGDGEPKRKRAKRDDGDDDEEEEKDAVEVDSDAEHSASEDDDSDSEGSSDESESEDDVVDTTLLAKNERRRAKKGHESEDDAEDSDAAMEVDGEHVAQMEDSDEEPGEDDGAEMDAEDLAAEALKAKAASQARATLSVKMPSLWADDADDDSESNGSGSDSDDEGADDEPKKLSKRAKKAQREAEEKRIRDMELENMSSKAPESAESFDRLVLANPNSSYLWVKYMAYHLQMAEIDKARAVGRRALKAISFREEQERMNVWVAMLNLENNYGTPDAMEKVFEESVQNNDPLKMYQQLVSIYERSEKLDKADETFQTMLKRFKGIPDIWINYGRMKMRHGKSIDARQILQRSLKSLPKRDHIDVIVKFGIMEFRHADVERGRTIFENVLSNYPKRVDLWSIYLDQEIRVGDLDVIRALFDRIITLNLSSKKMKFFFKRYLQFEKEHGTEDRVEYVKAKAREFVEAKTS